MISAGVLWSRESGGVCTVAVPAESGQSVELQRSARQHTATQPGSSDTGHGRKRRSNSNTE